MVKNLPCNVGDMSLIPDGGSEIPHTAEQLLLSAQLCLSATTTESMSFSQLIPDAAKFKNKSKSGKGREFWSFCC